MGRRGEARLRRRVHAQMGVLHRRLVRDVPVRTVQRDAGEIGALPVLSDSGFKSAEGFVRSLLERAGIPAGGGPPQDLAVPDRRFYARVVRNGSLGLGESYMDGWWDCAALD